MALDPGLHSGVAIRWHDGTATSYTIMPRDGKADITALYTLVVTVLAQRAELIVERFDTQSRMLSKYGILTIELVGGVTALAWTTGQAVVQQTPSQRLTWEPTAKLLVKELPGPHTDHEYSAMAHLLRREHTLKLRYDP